MTRNIPMLMQRLWLAAACHACFSLALGADLLIENVTVLSPELDAPLPDHHVLVHDERIARISRQAIKAPGAKRIDGRGKFLAPGLMDSHVHVSDAGSLGQDRNDPAATGMREAYFRQQPRSYLYFGVTQVLDPSNSPEGIDTFNAQPLHPDLFQCGAALALDGYPAVFLDKPERHKAFPIYIFEPANAAGHPLPEGEKASAHTPEAIVDLIATTDARCIKVFIEDGFGASSNWPMLSNETLKRVRAAADKRGLMVLAHANALDMQRIALDMPVDVLAHGIWNWGEFSDQPGLPAPIAAHLQKVHDRGIGYQPTLRVIYSLADLFRADTLKDPMYAKVVPPEILGWYGTEAGQWFKRQMKQESGGGPDNKIIHGLLQVADQGMRAARYLDSLSHPLLLGSDTPSAPTYGNQPGYDTYREMRLMAQAGIPLASIFKAGTLNNVRQFKLDKDYGSVEPGKMANLVLLETSPLETIRAWEKIDKVILHGQVIERETLQAGR